MGVVSFVFFLLVFFHVSFLVVVLCRSCAFVRVRPRSSACGWTDANNNVSLRAHAACVAFSRACALSLKIDLVVPFFATCHFCLYLLPVVSTTHTRTISFWPNAFWRGTNTVLPLASFSFFSLLFPLLLPIMSPLCLLLLFSPLPGYDSAGLVVDGNKGQEDQVAMFKMVGNVSQLEKLVKAQTQLKLDEVAETHCGMAHTRCMFAYCTDTDY